MTAAELRSLAAAVGCSLVLFALPGCQGMSGMSAPTADPTQAWSQSLVSGLAGKLHDQVSSLYTTALDDPEFAGEQGPFQQVLNDLRILQEDSDELHSQLEAGKSRTETLNIWQNIEETARDARESAGWTQLPDDFRAKAESAVGIVDQLKPFFGTAY